jgi:hypothetical protein
VIIGVDLRGKPLAYGIPAASASILEERRESGESSSGYAVKTSDFGGVGSDGVVHYDTVRV